MGGGHTLCVLKFTVGFGVICIFFVGRFHNFFFHTQTNNCTSRNHLRLTCIHILFLLPRNNIMLMACIRTRSGFCVCGNLTDGGNDNASSAAAGQVGLTASRGILPLLTFHQRFSAWSCEMLWVCKWIMCTRVYTSLQLVLRRFSYTCTYMYIVYYTTPGRLSHL